MELSSEDQARVDKEIRRLRIAAKRKSMAGGVVVSLLATAAFIWALADPGKSASGDYWTDLILNSDLARIAIVIALGVFAYLMWRSVAQDSAAAASARKRLDELTRDPHPWLEEQRRFDEILKRRGEGG